jgi:hypothetical protein
MKSLERFTNYVNTKTKPQNQPVEKLAEEATSQLSDIYGGRLMTRALTTIGGLTAAGMLAIDGRYPLAYLAVGASALAAEKGYKAMLNWIKWGRESEKLRTTWRSEQK